MTIIHQPVLLEETLNFLKPKKNHWYLDSTLGGAGHTIAILKTGAKVIAFDQDETAINRAKENIQAACPGIKLADYSPRLDTNKLDCILVNENFSKIDDVLTALNLSLSGALFDLGISTYQLKDPTRGFSFQEDAPLDMRMDRRLSVTAADLINALPQTHLARLFQEYADETYAPKIAAAIVKRRAQLPFKTTNQLGRLITTIKPPSRIHPATQVFQALRIAVNLELQSLSEALPQVNKHLRKDAPLLLISFHSGEDRLVKQYFKENPDLSVITKTPVTPTTKEITNNPASRSAKLRVAQKK